MMDAILSCDPKKKEIGEKILKNVGKQLEAHKLHSGAGSNKSKSSFH
jgi:hypothetical protein